MPDPRRAARLRALARRARVTVGLEPANRSLIARRRTSGGGVRLRTPGLPSSASRPPSAPPTSRASALPPRTAIRSCSSGLPPSRSGRSAALDSPHRPPRRLMPNCRLYASTDPQWRSALDCRSGPPMERLPGIRCQNADGPPPTKVCHGPQASTTVSGTVALDAPAARCRIIATLGVPLGGTKLRPLLPEGPPTI